MNLEKTELEGVFVLTPRRFQDDRGFFSESWNKRVMAKAGLDMEFVQDNHSFSTKQGTVRGLHFQAPPLAQGKLVRCGRVAACLTWPSIFARARQPSENGLASN